MVKLSLSAIVIIGLLIGGWFFLMGFNFSSFGFGQIGANYGPQTKTLQKPKVYTIGDNANPITVLATTLPQFALNLKDGQYSNIWTAHAQEQQGLVQAQAVNEKGDANLNVTTQFDPTSKQVVVTPALENSFKPGMYQLSVKVKTVTGKDITVTQDFAWGVLAINTNKAIYQPGQDVNIGMTVLDDVGYTKCIAANGVIVYGTAKVALSVTSPSGKVVNLSTDAGTIQGSPSCKDRSYSDSADFLAKLTNLNTVGRYKLHMEATTVFGTRSIDSFFTVQATSPAFDIERATYPTRIYPRYKYPVTVDVTPNKDYSGTVYDIVPSSFAITGVSDGGIVLKSGDYQKIQWQVNWQAGQLYTLSYTIKFPQVSPEYYLVGPLTIGNFTEGNEWQIASDSLFNPIQYANNFATSGVTINATMRTGVSSNDLLVMNCYKVTGTTARNVFTTSNNSPWSRAYDGGQRNQEIAGQYYRVVTGAEIGATTMTCNAAGGNTGEIAIEVMEFSGNATIQTVVKDTNANFRGSAVRCNNTNDIMQTLTPNNPDELVVTQFVTTDATRTPVTPTNHTTETGVNAQGFTDLNPNQPTSMGFTGSTRAYDSAWAEVVGGDGRDTVIWTGGNTSNCYNGGASYNPTISISQGSYQFFLNQDSLIPGAAQGSKNTPFTLTTIGEDFRVRMLLEVDATGSLQIGLQSLDLNLYFAPLPSSGLCAGVSNWTPVATVGAQIQTDIAWNQNPSIATSGAQISATANDPSDFASGGYNTLLQSYYQDDFSSNGNNDGGVYDNNGDISNDYYALADAQAGEWDFSLVDNTGGANEGTYCLELAGAGTAAALSAYRQYPEVTFAKAGVVIRGSFGQTKIKGTGGAACANQGGSHIVCGTKIK